MRGEKMVNHKDLYDKNRDYQGFDPQTGKKYEYEDYSEEYRKSLDKMMDYNEKKKRE